MKNPFKSRRGRWIIIGCAAALIIAGVATYFLTRETPRTDYPDYHVVLGLCPGTATLYYPSEEQLRMMPHSWPTVPPEQNAAVNYMRAAGLLVRNSSSNSAPQTPYEAGLQATVTANQAAFEEVFRGNKLAYCRAPALVDVSQTIFIVPSAANYAADLRELARACQRAGAAEEALGHPDKAAEYYLADIRMGAQLRPGTIMEALVGAAVCYQGLRSLDALIAGGGMNADALKRSITVCRAAETTPAELADSAICERESMIQMTKTQGFGPRISFRVFGAVRAMDDLVKDASVPLHVLLAEPRAQQMLEGTLKPGFFDRLRVMVEPAYLRSRVELGRTDVRLRMTEIRAAIALYEREHGKPPERLDALCAAFLPAVPLDPFSGKPMKYALTEDGWRAWSVWDDLKDDDGKIANPKNDPFGGPDYSIESKAANKTRVPEKGP